MKLALQIHRIPKEYLIKVFPTYNVDQSLDEWVRHWNIWDRLDFLDFENTKIGLPSVEKKQRIVIGAEILRNAHACDRLVEHPT